MHTNEFILKKKMQKVILVVLLLIALVVAQPPPPPTEEQPKYASDRKLYQPRDEKSLNKLRWHLAPQIDNIRDFVNVKKYSQIILKSNEIFIIVGKTQKNGR